MKEIRVAMSNLRFIFEKQLAPAHLASTGRDMPLETAAISRRLFTEELTILSAILLAARTCSVVHHFRLSIWTLSAYI